VRRSARGCTAPLAPIENPGGLRLDLLRSSPRLAPVFALLDTPLEDLFVRPFRGPPRPVVSRGFSRHDIPHIQALTVPSADSSSSALWFKVRKSSGDARLVQSLGKLSACLLSPKVPFARLHDLLRNILSQTAVVLANLNNWFY